ncbi:uncharacterized protein LOC121138854 [Mesocricetus auratus]|uniref:Uncharacterized protein LOC121138854 n=1 Tax=Mesocricetus auratus TaxID=10036 RepID=A0ABM2X4C0_MESAU|nr:uncharacterized protein LOC121138854 [Mesocricetus auratus]XP_040597712.1 uncharacterized protein LOC121138854 [Mesocricetus auratus]XP_040597713.1 uncharacterized protein LOC121138854 [Mesocricetus auratus]XP_040597714.1 uncharacterized protein LOC121138854 [Mesocricetus auratus]
MAMERTSFHDLNSHKKDSQGPSFLDSGTQKVLETHLTRCLVKLWWSLALRGLKTIPIFNRNKTTSVPFQMPSNASLSLGDSRDNSLPTNLSILGESFQHAPEETAMKEIPLCNPQSEIPESYSNQGNSVPAEAPTSIQEDNMKSMSTAESHLGRSGHFKTVHKSCTGKPVSTPGLIRGMCQSQKNEHVSLGKTDQPLSLMSNSVASQSTRSRNTRELEKAENKVSCDWAFTTAAHKMRNFLYNNKHLWILNLWRSLKIHPHPELLIRHQNTQVWALITAQPLGFSYWTVPLAHCFKIVPLRWFLLQISGPPSPAVSRPPRPARKTRLRNPSHRQFIQDLEQIF